MLKADYDTNVLYFKRVNAYSTKSHNPYNHHMRARRALSLFKDVLLRTRRALLP